MSNADILTFFVMNITVGIIIYLGRLVYQNRLPKEWIILASGFALYSFARFFEIMRIGPIVGRDVLFSTVFDVVAGVHVIVGVILLLTSQERKMILLKKREEEIRAIMEKLKDKFMRSRLNENEINAILSPFYRELAEIEVEMEKVKK